MADQPTEWQSTLIRLLTLASRLEGEGQYNNAKLFRAAAEALLRQAVSQSAGSLGKDALNQEARQTLQALTALKLEGDFLAATGLLTALERGIAAMEDGRLPMIDETPDPYVCRSCGHVSLGKTPQNCPTCTARGETFIHLPPMYWLEALEPPEALKALRRGPAHVSTLIKGLADAKLHWRSQPGEWSLHETITHLRDAQVLFDFRLNLMLELDEPHLESQAVFAWVGGGIEQPQSTQEILTAFIDSRQKTLDLLDCISPEDWRRRGLHEEFGWVTIRQQASYFAMHELTHLPQLDRLRLQSKSSAGK